MSSEALVLRHFRYRKAKNFVMMGLTIAATVMTLTPLFLVFRLPHLQGRSQV